MKNKQKGFTLIELMIVIAIIAILMSYAIPAYQDYTVRAKASEGLSLAAGLRTYLSESWVASSDISTFNSGSNGVPVANTIIGTYVSEIQVNSGVITVSFANDDRLNGETLTLTPYEPGVGPNTSSSLIWECTSSLLNRYLPSECRAP